jgi:hypothetical protein
MIVITQQSAPIVRPAKWGKTGKAKRVVKVAGQRADIEENFISVAAKAIKADRQRADRKAKRK